MNDDERRHRDGDVDRDGDRDGDRDRWDGEGGRGSGRAGGVVSRDAVWAVVRPMLGSRGDVGDDATLESLGLDSLEVIELAFEVQDRFDIVLSSRDLVPGTTMGELVDRVVEACR